MGGIINGYVAVRQDRVDGRGGGCVTFWFGLELKWNMWLLKYGQRQGSW